MRLFADPPGDCPESEPEESESDSSMMMHRWVSWTMRGWVPFAGKRTTLTRGNWLEGAGMAARFRLAGVRIDEWGGCTRLTYMRDATTRAVRTVCGR